MFILFAAVVVLRWLLLQQWIADTVAALLSLGFLSRIAPGSFIINMALSRQFRIREQKTLEFRGEAFNQNRVNLGNPNATPEQPYLRHYHHCGRSAYHAICAQIPVLNG